MFLQSREAKTMQALGRLRFMAAVLKKLLIPKLDLFSRKVSFISGVIEQGIELVVCEYPNVNTFFLHLLACFAEEERRQSVVFDCYRICL